MGPNVICILAPSPCKAQKLKISDCRYLYNSALFPIYLEFKFLLQVFLCGFQKGLCGSFTLSQNYNIVCITNQWNAPAFHLLIESVQVAIDSSGRSGPLAASPPTS